MQAIDPIGTFSPWKESGFYFEDKKKSLHVFKQGTVMVCNVIYIFKILLVKNITNIDRSCKVSFTQDKS